MINDALLLYCLPPPFESCQNRGALGIDNSFELGYYHSAVNWYGQPIHKIRRPQFPEKQLSLELMRLAGSISVEFYTGVVSIVTSRFETLPC